MNGNLSLRRSRQHRMLGGVIGGLAANAGIDPTLPRVITAIAAVLMAGVPAVMVYAILWAVIPLEGEP